MRDIVTTVLDLFGFGAAVYGGFQYDPTLGWFVLAAVIVFVSWKFAK